MTLEKPHGLGGPVVKRANNAGASDENELSLLGMLNVKLSRVMGGVSSNGGS